jgi:hypothetical protein
MEKSYIQVRRKSMRRMNPMCRPPYNRLYVEGPVEMDNGRLAELKIENRNENDK